MTIYKKELFLVCLSVLIALLFVGSAVAADAQNDASMTNFTLYAKTGNVSDGSEPSFSAPEGNYTLLYYWEMSQTRTTYRFYAADVTVNASGIFENGNPYTAPADMSDLTFRCDDNRPDLIYETLDAAEITAVSGNPQYSVSLSTPVSNNNTWFLLDKPAILYVDTDLENNDLDCQVTVEALVLGDTETTITLSGDHTYTKTFTPGDKKFLSGCHDTSTGGDKQYTPQPLFYKYTFSGVIDGTYELTVSAKDGNGETVARSETIVLGEPSVPGITYDFYLRYELNGVDKSGWYSGTGVNASSALAAALTDAKIAFTITEREYGISIDAIDGLATTEISKDNWVWWSQFRYSGGDWVSNDLSFDSYPDNFIYALVYGDANARPHTSNTYYFYLQYELDGVDKSGWYSGTGVNASSALIDALTAAGIQNDITIESYGASVNEIDGLPMTQASGSWVWWVQFREKNGAWVLNNLMFNGYPNVYTYALAYGDKTSSISSSAVRKSVTYTGGTATDASVPDVAYVSLGAAYTVTAERASADGFIFTGWNCNGQDVGERFIVNDDVTLDAQWRALPDGFVPTLDDVSAVRQYLAGKGEYNETYDISGDGRVSLVDLVLMAQYVADHIDM